MSFMRSPRPASTSKAPTVRLPPPFNKAQPLQHALETDLQSEVTAYLSAMPNAFYARMEVSGHTVGGRKRVKSQMRGLPDCLLWVGGVPFGIELKNAGKSVYVHQVETMLAMERAGVHVAIACSLQGVIRFLEGKQHAALLTVPGVGAIRVF